MFKITLVAMDLKQCEQIRCILNAAKNIADAAARMVGTDLIIAVSHKPTVSDYLLGSNAARILRHAKCSALVVR